MANKTCMWCGETYNDAYNHQCSKDDPIFDHKYPTR